MTKMVFRFIRISQKNIACSNSSKKRPLLLKNIPDSIEKFYICYRIIKKGLLIQGDKICALNQDEEIN